MPDRAVPVKPPAEPAVPPVIGPSRAASLDRSERIVAGLAQAIEETRAEIARAEKLMRRITAVAAETRRVLRKVRAERVLSERKVKRIETTPPA